MADFEVHLSLSGRTRRTGLARGNVARGRETIMFEYANEWLDDEERFPLAPELYRRVAFNVLVSNVDDHLRNHGFLWVDRSGWTLSPAYDLNPVPTDLKARVLTTSIDPVESTCSIELLEEAAEYYALPPAGARAILKEVAQSTRTWRTTAQEAGASSKEIQRMASAFEHDDLRKALALP
ncbi:MAG: HipA domain protein [Verrucomicrobiales bacterium]|nr:HipA domain protein [Verrucomicrobiales bacterium]